MVILIDTVWRELGKIEKQAQLFELKRPSLAVHHNTPMCGVMFVLNMFCMRVIPFTGNVNYFHIPNR
jgi:hypothetical protein